MALRRASLSDGFRPVDGRPDARSWPVQSGDGQKVGTVRDLLVDEEGRIRYLAIETEGRDDRVLVPVEHVQLDRNARCVRLPEQGADALRELPVWSGRIEDIDAGWERHLGRAWDQRLGGTLADRHPAFYGNKPGALDSWGRDTAATQGGSDEGTDRTANADPGERRSGPPHLERLERLEDLGIGSGDHDPRGWVAVGRDGQRLGRVDHLMADRRSMKASYLVIDLGDTVGASTQHVLVPTQDVALDPAKSRVRIESIDKAGLRRLPRYRGEPLDRAHEERIAGAWRELRGGAGGTGGAEDAGG